MRDLTIESRLAALYRNLTGRDALKIAQLSSSGSERRYYRITGVDRTVIGTWHPVKEETRAFVAFSKHFRALNLRVPEVFAVDEDELSYLQEDLGDTSLFDMMKPGEPPGDQVSGLLRQAVRELARFQVGAGRSLDYRNCYPRQSFDRQSIQWDLNYFKYCFLRPHTQFNEQRLEDDFERLVQHLLAAPAHHFMYRDFQSRNIMVRNGETWYIDFQGGRKGPLAYDLASLLFQARAGIPQKLRRDVEEEYMQSLIRMGIEPDKELLPYYHGFILMRLLQVLGAYGFRGLVQRKPHFIASIPYAIEKVRWWLDQDGLKAEMPELTSCLESIVRLKQYEPVSSPAGVLTVEVSSFAYKDGIPPDTGGHGGGFVFDCRALPNPGREERYKELTGFDPEVVQFMEPSPEVGEFMQNAFRLVDQAINNYLSRGFTRLSVAFGCTGGQHRSVYCAERLGRMIRDNYPAHRVVLRHNAAGITREMP